MVSTVVDRIRDMLASCEAGESAFPPAELYNENWLLRLVLDWFARHEGDRYPLSPMAGARWFSQAWLPSAFLTRFRGDRLAEALRRLDRRPEEMDDLAFLVLAPHARLDDGIFEWDLSLDAIRRKVRRRVEDYAGERDHWFREWFDPTWRRVEVRSMSWEDIIDVIAFHSTRDGQVIDSFYGQCLRFNRPQARPAAPRPIPPITTRPDPSSAATQVEEEDHSPPKSGDPAPALPIR